MSSGLFILMDGEESVKQCINKGVYGFFMPPIFEDEVNSRSKHYAVLCDYGCCYEGTEIFFFTRRKVFYGGRITKSNGDNPVFYLNGNTSPMGRKSNSEMFVDLSNVQPTTEDEGVYYLGKNTRNEDRNRALPFVIEFETNELSGKQISSDDLYFELGKYNFPFPSNAIQKLAIVTLTPKETEILIDLMKESPNKIFYDFDDQIKILDNKKVLFDTDLIDKDIINESHLEFTLLANSKKLNNVLSKSLDLTYKEDFVQGRQIPLCPFKPMQFDRADICLYDKNNPIRDGTLPNVVIELKKDQATYAAYEQVTKYLRWLEQITSEEDFEKIKAIIVAPKINRNINMRTLESKNITLKYQDKITLFSLYYDTVVDFR